MRIPAKLKIKKILKSLHIIKFIKELERAGHFFFKYLDRFPIEIGQSPLKKCIAYA